MDFTKMFNYLLMFSCQSTRECWCQCICVAPFPANLVVLNSDVGDDASGNEMNADKPAYDTSEPAFAAATDVAARITGIKTAGYNVKHKCFIPKDVGLSGTPTKFYNVYDKLRAAGEQLKVDNDNTTVLVDNKLVTLDEAISKYIDIYINTNQTISKIHTESQEEEKVQEGIPRSDSFANYVTKIEGSSLHRQ